MKIRLVVALAGLAISFALPTLAQQKETVDPQLRETLVALEKIMKELGGNNVGIVLLVLRESGEPVDSF